MRHFVISRRARGAGDAPSWGRRARKRRGEQAPRPSVSPRAQPWSGKARQVGRRRPWRAPQSSRACRQCRRGPWESPRAARRAPGGRARGNRRASTWRERGRVRESGECGPVREHSRSDEGAARLRRTRAGAAKRARENSFAFLPLRLFVPEKHEIRDSRVLRFTKSPRPRTFEFHLFANSAKKRQRGTYAPLVQTTRPYTKSIKSRKCEKRAVKCDTCDPRTVGWIFCQRPSIYELTAPRSRPSRVYRPTRACLRVFVCRARHAPDRPRPALRGLSSPPAVHCAETTTAAMTTLTLGFGAAVAPGFRARVPARTRALAPSSPARARAGKSRTKGANPARLRPGATFFFFSFAALARFCARGYPRRAAFLFPPTPSPHDPSTSPPRARRSSPRAPRCSSGATFAFPRPSAAASSDLYPRLGSRRRRRSPPPPRTGTRPDDDRPHHRRRDGFGFSDKFWFSDSTPRETVPAAFFAPRLPTYRPSRRKDLITPQGAQIGADGSAPPRPRGG